MSNAPSRAKVCVELLKDLECKDVEYVMRESIPFGHFVIFIPSGKIQGVIEDSERLGQYIETINTNFVEFTPNGKKFIWDEPISPSFPQKITVK